MQNENKEIVDLYIPRKCSATNNLITAKDHASVQMNIGEVSFPVVVDLRNILRLNTPSWFFMAIFPVILVGFEPRHQTPT